MGGELFLQIVIHMLSDCQRFRRPFATMRIGTLESATHHHMDRLGPYGLHIHKFGAQSAISDTACLKGQTYSTISPSSRVPIPTRAYTPPSNLPSTSHDAIIGDQSSIIASVQRTKIQQAHGELPVLNWLAGLFAASQGPISNAWPSRHLP